MKLYKSGPLCGTLTVPGDKSISHRAIMLGALAQGDTHITGFLMGDDCLSTIECFQKMGVKIEVCEQTVIVHGVGMHGLTAPNSILYTGNSGTTTRLLCGILAGQDFSCSISGDASIQRRPMGRVIKPLRQMGAHIDGVNDNYCPLTIHGTSLHGITYEMPVASAQLKSAILLAGLYADHPTTVLEPGASRDHTENMLRAFGATVETVGKSVTLLPPTQLTARDMIVPADISSAAFFLVAATLIPGSELTLCGVGVNQTRTGILDALRQMGADIQCVNPRNSQDYGMEPVCDLVVRSAQLHGTVINHTLVPRMIDEIPILAVAAAFAEGETVVRDAQELKVKESNRIAAMVAELSRAGADIQETEDGFIIRGGKPLHGASFQTYHDHRIAMSMAVCAMCCEEESEIQNPEVVAISYPDFFRTLSGLGG